MRIKVNTISYTPREIDYINFENFVNEYSNANNITMIIYDTDLMVSYYFSVNRTPSDVLLDFYSRTSKNVKVLSIFTAE
jgi:hypothetical protein